MELSDKDAKAWEELDDIVQLSYTATGVNVIYSQYMTSTWQLHVLTNDNKYYRVLYHGKPELETLMKRRKPPAASASEFASWLLEGIVQGQSSVSSVGTFSVSDPPNAAIEIPLEPINDTNSFCRVSWDLLLKLILHIQKEGCSIKSAPHPMMEHTRNESPSAEASAATLKLQQENELLHARLRAVMSQTHQVEAGAAASPLPPVESSSSQEPSRPAGVVQPRRKGMSLVNPRVKRRRHQDG